MDFFEQLDEMYTGGRGSEIEPFLRNGLENAREEGNTDLTVTLLNELGSYYRGVSRYSEAGACFDEAIAVMDERGLQNTYGYAVALINSAGNWRMSGHPDVAERLFLLAKDILQKMCPETDYACMSLMNNLSLAYQDQGKMDEALAVAEHVLELVRAEEDSDHEIATSLNNIASILIRAGRFAEAVSPAREALELYDRMPQENVHHAAAINNMAVIQYYLGNLTEAADLLKQAAELNLHFFGMNEDYVRIMENIAVICEQTGNAAEADEYRRKAQAADEELERISYAAMSEDWV